MRRCGKLYPGEAQAMRAFRIRRPKSPAAEVDKRTLIFIAEPVKDKSERIDIDSLVI